MNNIEITCQVFSNISEIKKALEDNKFKFVEEFTLDDIYMYNRKTKQFAPNKGRITDTLIIRYANDDDKEIICKKRYYNLDGFEIGTEKRSLKIDDIKKAEELLQCLGYSRYLRMIDKNSKYENEEYIAFIQEVEDLGVFLEIEVKNGENAETEIKKLIELVKSFELKIGTKFDIRKAELLYKKQNSKRNA